ncbi:MAG: hypothetical protein H6747_15480 [Deltaproteobacteria bacterium]|nr:hypothetical protein [Deltaproteobacteria bacterium]
MTAIAFRWHRPQPVRARRLAARAVLLVSLFAAAVALSPRAALAVEPVLPPSAATQVTALLALDRCCRLPDGLRRQRPRPPRAVALPACSRL